MTTHAKSFAAISAALFVTGATAAFAQTFTPNTSSGYFSTPLFSLGAGHALAGLDVDPAGNVYYLDDSAAGGVSTKLMLRTAASGYATATLLYDFGADVFGAFVRVHGSMLYFGESTGGAIRSINLNTSTLSLIGTVVGSYEMAFRGTEAFISANPDTTFTDPQNRVSLLNLSNGQLDTILSTTDYSGPLAFDSAGNLLYGGSFLVNGGLFQYSAAQVNGMINSTAPDTSLTLGETALRFSNDYNQYLVWRDDAHLFRAGGSGVMRYDLTDASNGTFESIGQADGFGYFSGLATDQQGVYVAVSLGSGATGQSAVYKVVPEPGAAGLGIVGVAALALRRRRNR